MWRQQADNFYDHVNTTEFPDYLQFIVKPMCISTLEKMVDNREIASTQGLLAETKWIHHNCVVYNGLNAGLTGVAKALKKICRDECIKIEICPECFLHNCRHGAKGFIRVCKRPHVPVWARMTGFPFWPAKAMGIKDGGVQVFFFADHNRAVVPPSEVFLYSQDIPFPNQRNSRKQRLEDAVEEMKQYLYQLMKKDYKLKLAPCQTRYDPNRDEEHRQMMLPNYVEWVPQKRPRTCVPLNLSYSILITPPSGVPWDLSNLVEVGLNPQWKPGQVHTRDRRLVRAKTKRGTGSCQLATSWKIKAEKLPMHLKDRTNEDASTLMVNSMVHLNLESTHLDSSSSIDKSLMIAASKAKKKKLLQIIKSPSSLGSDMKRRRKTVSPKPNSKDKVIPEGASKPGLLVPSKEACPDSSAHKVLENSDKAFINGSFSIPKETSIDSGKKSPNVMLKGGVTSELSSEVKTAPTASSSVDKEDITVHLKTTNNIKTSEKSDSGCRTAANDGDSNSMELIEIKKELIDECEMDGDILSPPSKDTALMVYSPMLEPKISLTVLNEQVHTDSPTTSSLMTERLLSMDPISKEISFALSPEVNLFLQPSTKISKHNNEVSSDSLGQQHLQIGSPPASPQLAIKKLSDKKMNQPGSSGAETANDTRVQLPPNGTDSQPLPNHANDPKLFPSLKIPLNSPSLLPNLLMNYYPAIANPKTPEDVKAGTMLNSLSYEVSSILIGLEAFQNKTRLPNGIPKKSNLHEYKDSILELLLRLVLYDNERNMNLQTSETVFYNYFYNTNLNPLTDQYCHTNRDKTKCSSLCKIIDEDIKSLSKECQRQVEDAKKKLWCSFCSKEAFLHCCLKAAYCSRHCQHPGLNPTPLSQVRADCEYDTGSPKGRWRNKRRRCGLCDGCLVLDNCGICSVCINPNTHQVCKLRQCSHLQHKGSKKPRKKTSLHDTHPDMRSRPHNVSNSNMMQIQSNEQPALHLSAQFEAMARHFNVLEAQRNIANNSGFGIQNGLVNHGAPNVSRPLRDNEGNYPNIHPGRSSDHWPNPYCVPHHNGRMFPSHQGPLILPPDNLNVQSFPNSHGPLNVCLPQEGGPNTSATLISGSSLVKHSSTKLSSSNTSTTLNHMERSMLNYLPSYPHPSMGHKPQHSVGSANQPTPNYEVPPHLSNTHQSMGSRPTLPNPQYSMELLPNLPNHNQSSGHLFHLPDPRQLMGHPIQNLKGP
uniref:Uncharacterized protein n=1 Tax=Timema monikensis TaxID=170555 RepID=A0A7R9HRS2_9NEOP|nr:unnamed protein product [Timema monikensis]